MSRGRGSQVALLLVAGLATAGCKERYGTARGALSPRGHPPAAQAESAAATGRTRLPGALATVPSSPVVDWTGPDKEPFEMAGGAGVLAEGSGTESAPP